MNRGVYSTRILEIMREIKEEEGETVRVELSLLVTQKEGKEDCCRWSYRQKDECGNKDRGVYSLIFWNSEDK